MHLLLIALMAAITSFSFVYSSQTAFAGQIIWNVTSRYPYTAQIKFFSRSRNVEWPRPGMAWELNDYKTKTFKLNCNKGEKVCYGAWDTGTPSTYWGVGGNKHACSDCCRICSEEGTTANTTLVK